LIARQRDNLKHTFAHLDDTTVETPTAQRLARTERELAEATAEFTQGIERRAGPVPCLHEAQDAMQAAAPALEGKDLKAGGGSEETALAGLIKARQNIRKFLSQSSSSASACRKFDQEQKQKIRKPPKEDKKERLAKLQGEIEKLAKEEKKFSEEVAPKSGGAEVEKKDGEKQDAQSAKKPGSSGSSPSAGEKPAEAKASLAERQQKSAEKAAELQKLVHEDDALTELARERMDAAAAAAQASAQSMENGRRDRAGEQAADAAEQLERLARHVAGLKTPDLATRVGQSENLARQVAKEQQGLGKDLKGRGGRGPAEDERRLAEEARTLADLLGRLQRDAADKDRALADQLREASDANPPAAIVEQMRRAAEALKQGRPDQARPDVEQSARMLDGLGEQLGVARHGLTGPQLDRLMALEKQAAEAQKALESVTSDREKAEAEKKVAELRDALEAVPKEGKLAEASDQLDAAMHEGGTWTSPAKPDKGTGLYVPPVHYGESVRRVVQALQAKIQEVILRDALLDKDEAVPPQYRKLVEEYYRVLSEDLR
jgi:hypothetical protein